MALPTPVLSDGDIVEVQSGSYESARLIWNTWSQDPIKAVVLQAILSFQFNLIHSLSIYRRIFSVALSQNKVYPLYYSLSNGAEVYYPNVLEYSQIS